MQDAPGGLRYLVNGWEASGLFVARSGDPLTVTAGNSNGSGSGQSRDRAVFLGGSPYGATNCAPSPSLRCKSWLNLNAFSANLQTTGAPVNYGNIAKGSFTGPRYTDVDMAVARDFPFSESASLEFRAEYFNLFNHTNFGDPNTTQATGTSTTFGEITSTSPVLALGSGSGNNDPRIAQFSLKLSF